ncbi:MAG: hypothetical protein JW715_16070, partial [Sedimentisphaerales bacterium]|nr:hypothetical protein [Sedimentisphaerales bacterium]
KVYQEEKIQQAAEKPVLVLLTDAQTNNAPFVTRTEAHERVVNQSRPVKLLKSILTRRSSDESGKRTWLIPYMGDASCVAAAGLRFFGINSQVLPTNTQRGYELARKHIYTEVCHPLKGVVGDALAFLYGEIERAGREYVENNYLVMLPTTSGPCRFGKYTELTREFLDVEGLEKIPVAGPSSETDYSDIPLPKGFSSSDKQKMQQMLFKGINASDLLGDIILRFRPYAADKNQVKTLYAECLKELEDVVQNGAITAELVQWGKDTVKKFEALPLKHKQRFPLVLYIGEIYMRQHDPYTNFVIEQLEEQGLETVRDPITDWLDYVNKVIIRNSKRDLKLHIGTMDFRRAVKDAKKYLHSIIKGKYMSSIEKKLAEPFHQVLEGRHVLPKPMEMIETLEANHEFHGNIEGESPLSAGISYHFMRDMIRPKGDAYISGIFHVGPFTCMQEGVATAKIEAMAKELRKKQPDLVFPIIHAFFGDSASANIDSEIAVFVEQCYQKRQMLKERYQPKTPAETAARKPEIKEISQPRRREESVSKTHPASR